MAEIAGLKLIVPTSVAGSGVSVSASGKVTFTAATSVSVNGVFDSTYDNYLVVMRFEASLDTQNVYYRLRTSGSDATGSDYTRQRIWVTNTSVTAGRSSGTYGGGGGLTSTTEGGAHLYLYGAALAQPTASRSVVVNGISGATIYDEASTHSLSTSYDGLSVIIGSGNATGALTVYGLSQ